MHFSAEHRFDAPRREVACALGDPAFYEGLELPDLALVEVATTDGDEGATGVALRYEFTGNLDPVARRLLGGTRPTWRQEVRLRGDTGGRLSFAADANPRLLHGSATFSLEALGGETLRRLSGELVVAVPAVGRVAERKIVPGVLARLDAEADALRRYLS